MAFSTAGVLHNFTNSTRGALGTDLFVKHTSAQPPIDLPWPLPRKFSRGATTLCLGANFHIRGVGTSAQSSLERAIGRYEALVLVAAASAARTQTRINRAAGDVIEDVELQLDVNESYSLYIPPTGGIAELTAATQYGARHGLETFTQLVSLDAHSDGSTSVLRYAPWKIEDAPRFAWRGLMLDTSRHFFSVEAIEGLIAEMAYSKLNVFQ